MILSTRWAIDANQGGDRRPQADLPVSEESDRDMENPKARMTCPDDTMSLEVAFDASAVNSFLLDRDMRVLRANPAALSMFPVGQSQWLGASFCELFEGEDRGLCRLALQRIHEDEIDRNSVELRLDAPGERSSWTQLHVSAVRGDAGGLIGCFVQLYELAERMPVAALHYDRSARLIYANRAARKLLGEGVDRMLGKNPTEFTESTEVGEACLRALQEVIRHPIAIELDLGDVMPASGDFVAHFRRLIPQRNRHDEVVGVIALAGDVELEQRLNALVENSPDIIARFDPAGRVRYVNPVLESLDDLSVREVIGRRLDELSRGRPTEQAAVLAELAGTVIAVGASGKGQDLELAWPMRRGMHYFDVRCVAEIGPAGVPTGVLCFARDITAMKAVDRASRQSREQLRRLVARRDALLEQERKRIAREMHDELGQLLTSIRSGLGQLEREVDGDRGTAASQRIQELMSLVDQTVHVVRDVATSLRPAALDMGIVPALEWQATDFSRHTGIACRLHARQERLVLEDHVATTLFRSVQESLTNVAKHAQARRVDIHVAIEGGDLLMRIEDDGRGFDAAAGAGKGLGLVAMRERVSLLDGQVAILSSPGNGTTIVVSIPLKPRQDEK